jgi:hypothetical protein
VWIKTGLEAQMMNQNFNQFAEALVFVHGRRAEAEAALHASLCERSGDSETAATWREVQQAVRRFASENPRSVRNLRCSL